MVTGANFSMLNLLDSRGMMKLNLRLGVHFFPAMITIRFRENIGSRVFLDQMVDEHKYVLKIRDTFLQL